MEKRKWTYRILLTFMTLILCFVGTLHIRSYNQIQNLKVDEQALKIKKLEQDLADEKTKSANANTQLDRVKSDLNSLMDAKNSGDVKEEFSSKLQQAELFGGLCDVRGVGVRIKVDSDPDGVIDRNGLVVLVYELTKSGAEAVSINGNRIVYNSTIEINNKDLYVNGVKCENPIVVEAIGNSNVLLPAVNSIKQKYDKGLKITPTSEKDIVINGYQGAVDFQYAAPYKRVDSSAKDESSK